MKSTEIQMVIEGAKGLEKWKYVCLYNRSPRQQSMGASHIDGMASAG